MYNLVADALRFLRATAGDAMGGWAGMEASGSDPSASASVYVCGGWRLIGLLAVPRRGDEISVNARAPGSVRVPGERAATRMACNWILDGSEDSGSQEWRQEQLLLLQMFGVSLEGKRLTREGATAASEL